MFELLFSKWYSLPMNPQHKELSRPAGQAAMEYLILLGVMTIIALLAFKNLLPLSIVETNSRFTEASKNIIGNAAKTTRDGPFPYY